MLIKVVNTKKIENALLVANILTEVLKAEGKVDQDKEHFWCIGLNAANRIKYLELVSLGLIDQALIHPREVFRYAIMQGTSKLVIAHNHTAGTTDPSSEDNNVTKTLAKAGGILGITLLDHIIITSDGKYYSYKDSGELS